MNLNLIKTTLEENIDIDYRDFSIKLIPDANLILGVRYPILKKIARKIVKENYQTFLLENDYSSHELLLIHGFVLGYLKEDIEIILKYLDDYLDKVNDWAVCDSLARSLDITKKEHQVMWNYIVQFQNSTYPYKLRFMIVMMMRYYLNDQYADKVITIVDKIRLDHYYVKMAIAWTVATYMGKYPRNCFAYLEESSLDKWTYNKSLQKMIESYRVSETNKKKIHLLRRP